LTAYDYLLRGLAYFRGFADEDNRRACEMFEKAVGLDPNYAPAQAYLAFVRVALHGYTTAPAEVREAAVELATRAVELDPQDGRCHRILARICFFQREYDTAEHHARRALHLNPNDADGMIQLSALLCARGRPEEALAWMDAAVRLNPFPPTW